MKGSLQPSHHAKWRIPATVSYPPISVYPGVYQSAIAIRPNQHSCGLQPDFIKSLTFRTVTLVMDVASMEHGGDITRKDRGRLQQGADGHAVKRRKEPIAVDNNIGEAMAFARYERNTAPKDKPKIDVIRRPNLHP